MDRLVPDFPLNQGDFREDVKMFSYGSLTRVLVVVYMIVTKFLSCNDRFFKAKNKNETVYYSCG